MHSQDLPPFAPDAPPVIAQCDGLAMRYGEGQPVLRDVHFQLERGGFYFLLGPSGAGKTTLLRLLYLAERPSLGRAALFGRDMESLTRRDRAELRRRIGVVYQDFRLLDHLTAAENVALPLTISGSPPARAAAHAEELLRWVGLEDCAHSLPRTLSGGQQQRVAIARAVVTKPDLLLADEPTGNVDARMAARIGRLLDEMNRMGCTVVVATHDENLVRGSGRTVLRVEDGRVTQEPAAAWGRR